jgi:hypothetical protein
MGSDTESSAKADLQPIDSKLPPHVANEDDVDVAAKLAVAADGSLDSETDRRLRLAGPAPASYKVDSADPLPQAKDRFAPHAFNV